MGTPPTKILVVDDELHTAASVTLALGPAYQVDAVSDAHEAFELLKQNSGGFKIIMTDHMMPGWAGWELIKRLPETNFRGKCIVLSGYLSPAIEAIYRSLGVEHVIHKPFDLTQLRDAVAASA
jgi:CheY-like chemotaxis protein